MDDKEKPYCPTCKTSLRVQTYEEIIAEIMKVAKVSRGMANLMFVPYVGPYPRWWCKECKKPWSTYGLINQIVSIKPMRKEEDK